ncbi:aminoglycoside adenylyltransferase domain-containing protein [Deinococcus planocerae]|uniref:aminoglycoside adenylyltransferase domain-containing protein n=1 Tax=Deinococcus planocerae TaxID=1737569 RepID=UPI000C7EE6BE|nr:aminoglycoside adenylyltransferase domain-containing protein [Deinococcus planocerae]
MPPPTDDLRFTPEVRAMLGALVSGVRAALGDDLVGVYLRGSLALGDFDPESSDLDFLVVTGPPVSDAQFAALADLHTRLAALDNPYAGHIEGSYIDRASLRHFAPHERRHPTVGPDWAFSRGEHGADWMLERWVVRERGVTLLGPDPRTLIEPITADGLRVSVRQTLRSWASQPDEPEWLRRRSYQAFAVQTMCRALFTLLTGELPSKPRAVAWALGALPGPWRSLIERSRAWHLDDTPDPSALPEVMRFVRWAASEGEAAVVGETTPGPRPPDSG